MYANLEILGHVIVNKDTKSRKNGNFCIENLSFAYNPKTTTREKLKFGRNMGANGDFMSTEFGRAWSSDHNFRGQKSAKVDKLELVYFGKYRY